MNKFYFLAFILCFQSAVAQRHEFTVDNLLKGSMLPSAAFTSYIKQKGFKTITDSNTNPDLTYSRSSKDKSVKQFINRWETADTVFISFQTTSKQEFENWQQELVNNNYIPYNEKVTKSWESMAAYQKANMIAKLKQLQDSTMIRYCLTLKSIKLPSATAIHYAEDLLQLSSHEYLVAVFGAQSVKKDQFYFSENEVNKCSILFPNTSNQVVFVWNDEENSKDISFLILGGLANNSSDASIFNGNQFHKWRSRQGIHLGMSLRELHTLNGKPIEFYAWDTDQPGFVLAKNDGHINLKNLGIQLQCLECFEHSRSTSQRILNSETVLHANDRVLVNSLIIVPNKPDVATK